MSVRLIILALLVLARTSAGEAAEIKVLSAGAVKAVIVNVSDAFEKETGHKLAASFGTVGVTRQKLAAEPADVVIMTDVAIDEAIRQGSVVAGTRNDIARAGVGVGVPWGLGVLSPPGPTRPETLGLAILPSSLENWDSWAFDALAGPAWGWVPNIASGLLSVSGVAGLRLCMKLRKDRPSAVASPSL